MITEKRYQVFVSSTYEDLKKEREEVTKCLLKNNCIPVGMEQFPTIDMSQWEYITKMIDLSDYYILILAGRYGSIEEKSGIGYTEKEYNYAVEHDVPVLTFLIDDIGNLKANVVDDTKKRKKLNEFRDKVMKDKLVEFYKDTNDLLTKIVTSINQAFIHTPRPGWVRADQVEKSCDEQENDLSSRMGNVEEKLNSMPQISFGNTPPSGGKNGDIYFQYK